MKKFLKLYIIILNCLFLITACANESGSLAFQANGEAFVRQGFTSKDGWSIQFDQVFVTLSQITAYQTDPPFDATSGATPTGESVTLSEQLTIDLAANSGDAAPIVAGTVSAQTGQYNAISWEMVKGDNGATVQMIGTAVKDNKTLSFNLIIEDIYSYVCGEYVGDSRKGFVTADEIGDIEMTFHFDHIFGDAEAGAEEPLNTGALGFDPLANLAVDDKIELTQTKLAAQLTAVEYESLLDNLATLGHVGEGHCFEAQNGYTAHDE